MKNAIVTGASGNLGKVLCNTLVQNGFHVIAITGLTPALPPEPDDSSIEFHQVDLGSEMEVNQLCEELCTLHQRIDAAVFLAGGFSMSDIATSGKEQLDSMYRLNFETAYYFSRQIFLKMQQQTGGRLCFIGARPAIDSVAAVKMIPYALSKSLLIKLSEIYNAAGRKNGIVSSVIIPSIIDTPSNRKDNPDADYSKWVTPEKIAQTILFLFSDEGSALREGVFKLYGDS